jgi:hypothetical protein
MKQKSFGAFALVKVFTFLKAHRYEASRHAPTKKNVKKVKI